MIVKLLICVLKNANWKYKFFIGNKENLFKNLSKYTKVVKLRKYGIKAFYYWNPLRVGRKTGQIQENISCEFDLHHPIHASIHNPKGALQMLGKLPNFPQNSLQLARPANLSWHPTYSISGISLHY